MASTTPHLGLTLPDGSDYVSLEALNRNFTLTDVAITQRDRVWNLLDNSDFTNPVNQRGETNYTGAGYAIDRWRSLVNSNTLTIHNGYITTTGEYTQYIKGLGTGTYSAFAKRTDGTLIQLNTGYESANDRRYVSLPAGSYVWAALYEGEYTAETLPAYVPKGYAHEWHECRRYYQNHGYVCVSMIALSGAKVLDSTFPFLDGSMRTIPAVTGTLVRIYGQGVANESPDSGYTLSFSGNSLRVSYPSAITNVNTLQIYGVYFSDLAFDAEL